MGEAISVAVFLSGSEAFMMLSAQAFNVVTSDFNLPGPSSLAFLDRIRQVHREIVLALVTVFRAARS
jgi:CheY-like chemotaxis protein